jgi:polygalacturonase
MGESGRTGVVVLNNVKDFGATGDGVTDDRAAIQASIDDAAAQGKGGIFIPAGTYRVSRAEHPGRSLDLNGVQDFMVLGEGPASVVKLTDTSARTGDWNLFLLRNNCHRVVFRDLVIDGNRSRLTDPDEQTHGIAVQDGTDDLLVIGCTVRDCFGDGLRLLGTASAGEHVTRVRVDSCLFQTNHRTGLAVQRAVEKVVVANCIFDSTVHGQDIDFEPTGSDGPSDFIITGCFIKHANRSAAVALSGVSGPDPLVRAKFTGNIVVGGAIFSTDVRQLTV